MKDITDQEIIRRGNRPLDLFNKALERLQSDGFVTELWVDVKHDVITLRWVKNKIAWHITARKRNRMRDQLEQIGRHANFWFVSKQRGLGNEGNYAVRET